ncbi:MAG TPA: 2,3-bisphosphoglycerate-independent phosphoglycerate mutase [Candidatus Thermoplasmatota archaeon]|nr:2,3-bisphosphoglycerate-independent phosphoglycerate mutase [Candidatus Thermoplasmatota archaeon]
MTTERAILVILDGFGLRNDPHGNAIKMANAPVLGAFNAHLSRTHLETSGLAVGLPEGQMGNSEVGHMNIGAGRVIYQMLTLIDKSIRDGPFYTNPVLAGVVRHAKQTGGRVHFMGLVSDGGVHSQQDHLYALLDLARREGLPGDRVFVHAFTDGRDTGPNTGIGYLTQLEKMMLELGGGEVDTHGDRPTTVAKPYGRIATVGGRYYAMDRDKRWERTGKAYDAIVRGQGERATTAIGWMELSYQKGTTDEFILPAVVEGVDGRVKDGDAVFYFNFRPDRARQLTMALTQQGFEGFDVRDRPRIHFASMTQYESTFATPYAFSNAPPDKTLGEIVAKAGLKQLRIAETEKYAHVTYFLNGGEEKQFPSEDRIMVQSPKHVKTYDEKPEMSAFEITDHVVKALDDKKYGLIVLNFANCDMVGHTGNLDAAAKAVEAVDQCLGRLLAAARRSDTHVFITADHGNAEEMIAPDGTPQTAHTTLPVPLIYQGRHDLKLQPGILADVAPTILHVMGLPQPKEMTGKSLITGGLA